MDASSCTGGANTAIGREALGGLTGGDNNTAVGYFAGHDITTANRCVMVGREAGALTTDGGQNVYIGAYTGDNYVTASGNTMIGDSCATNSGTSGGNNICIGNSAGTDAVFSFGTHADRIVIGNNSNTNAYIKIDWTVTSDKRDKIEDGTVPHGLDFVNQLIPRSFWFRKDRDSDEKTGQKRYGFYAQDILELEGSDNVIIDNDDPENLKYKGEHLVPVLVNAIKELTARVKELESRQ